jgi:hypothetical protein
MRPGLRLLIETALQNQAIIGWNYAMRGYFSTSWVDAEQYAKDGSSTEHIRQTWLKPIIKVLWVFNKAMWTNRNSILHSTSVPLRELRESAVNSQIRHLYEQQHDFAVTDHILFDTPHTTSPFKEALDQIGAAIPSINSRQENWTTTFNLKFLYPSSQSLHQSGTIPISTRTSSSKKARPFLKKFNQAHRRQVQSILDT